MEITQQLKQNKIEDLLNINLTKDTISKALNIHPKTLDLAQVEECFIKPVKLLRETAELYRYQFLQTCSLWNSYCEQTSTDYEQYDMKTFQELIEDLKIPLGSVQQFNDIKDDLEIDVKNNKQHIQEIQLKEEESRILLNTISHNITSIKTGLYTFRSNVQGLIIKSDTQYENLKKNEQKALEKLDTIKSKIKEENDNINNNQKQIQILFKKVSDLRSDNIDFENQIKNLEDDIKSQENLQDRNNQEQIYLKGQINEVESQNKRLGENFSIIRDNKNGIDKKHLQMITKKQQLEQKIKDYDSKYNSMYFFQKKWQDIQNLFQGQQRQQWLQDRDTLEIDLLQEELSLKDIQNQEAQNQKQVDSNKSYLDDKKGKRGQNDENSELIRKKIKEISTQKNDQDGKKKKLEIELIEEKNKLESSIKSKKTFGNALIQEEEELKKINSKIQKLMESQAKNKETCSQLYRLQISDELSNSIASAEEFFQTIRDESIQATIELLEHEDQMKKKDAVLANNLQKKKFDNQQNDLRNYIEQTSKIFKKTFKNIAQKSKEIVKIIELTKKNMYIQQNNQKQVQQDNQKQVLQLK